MLINEFFVSEHTNYCFTRAKRTHEEEGTVRITSFVRLTKEYSYSGRDRSYERSESVWVDIREVTAREAAESVVMLPEHMVKFSVSEAVFSELVRLAASSPEELFHMTPEYVACESC
ncbi:hypothetical protein [Planococcus lenghuensis]|uniref:Uncharacterized protein n=1 Tax=Planococcus lenghuensis TaxID=2213202 RepID=A0A1Q2KVP6_9BACL|nr:hypothetical protein [Planococcus lenghuensis]AQQ51877.1 hypothetical protein B0X71_01250 [Planococcus lenghuensis]